MTVHVRCPRDVADSLPEPRLPVVFERFLSLSYIIPGSSLSSKITLQVADGYSGRVTQFGWGGGGGD